MAEFFNSLDGLGKTYLFCALFGTLLFVIRTGMSFLGGDTDVDGDFGDMRELRRRCRQQRPRCLQRHQP